MMPESVVRASAESESTQLRLFGGRRPWRVPEHPNGDPIGSRLLGA